MVPKVTIIMPVFNGEKFLKKSIESVLEQTYTDFLLLIINDGSTDKTEQIIREYNDKRICYVRNEKNLGIVKTLNKGLKLNESEYIVRFDADDIMKKDKIKKQLSFMEKNENVVVYGTQAHHIKSNGKIIFKSNMPTDFIKIKTFMLFQNPIYHPSVMMRASVFKENSFCYDEKYNGAEDFELWTRIIINYKIQNSTEYLINYRINETGITQTLNKKKRNLDTESSILFNYYANLGLSIQFNEVKELYKYINNYDNEFNIKQLNNIFMILKKIKYELIKNKIQFNEKYYYKLCTKYFVGHMISKNYGLKDFIRYSRIFFDVDLPGDKLELTKYLLKRKMYRRN